jgi:hypothetical protein
MQWSTLRLRNKKPLIAAAALAAYVTLSSIHWQFLHSVTNRELLDAAQREFTNHWSVMNTGKPTSPFAASAQAEQFAELSQQAVSWYQELQAKDQGRPLDQFPNVFWSVELADVLREDSILQPRMTMTVRIYATDCYVEKVSQEACVGYPSLITEERVALRFQGGDDGWQVSNYELLAEYLFPRDDKLFWLCLADGEDSDCPLAPTK